MSWLLVALGAGVGAPARYLLDRAIQSWHRTLFPWGTVTVNVLASLVLGLLTGAAGTVSGNLALLAGAGFCGALSTYSAFSYETLRLAGLGARWQAVGNVALTLVAGLGAGALGWWLALSLR
ncbi:fluoride efflux transporter FluC [Jatrophihabitans sp.]|uniref:fluoride efflux transporter FluC n=1 Tax=Jatrophihabitans sp. TaxID=1932789 RepID=UPI002BB0A9CC|nr:CrcB family protein [Jatrophihabitans sp.]